ncbi:MAG: rhodanese-like domain-containing protein [bacterium]
MRMLFVAMLMMFSTNAWAQSWILSPEKAIGMLATSTVLDVRGATAFTFGHIKGSTRVTWQQFSKSEKAFRGELLPDAALQKAIRAVGVSNDKPVIVVGDPDAWGEDGRIVWMLRAAGHPNAFGVDGGYPALNKAGAPTQMGRGASLAKGNFSVRWDTALLATTQEVKDAIGKPVTILDVREAREFQGKTPYGESRGGHVPGAKHLWFRDLLTEDGRLLPQHQLQERLTQRGVSKDRPIIAYCTGGIRSGWMVMVLRSLGYDASNYAGSMWEWSSLPAQSYPLE